MTMSGVAEIPLAIVGMACRLPAADDLDALWQLLLNGGSDLSDLPEDRFDRDLFLQPAHPTRAQSYTALGGATADLDPNTLTSLLPQSVIQRSHPVHLKLLHVVFEALCDAGLDRAKLKRRKVGVYVGHTPPGGLAGRIIFARQVAQTAQYLRSVPGLKQTLGGSLDDVIREIIESFRAGFHVDHPQVRMRSNAYHGCGLITQAFDLDGPSIAFDAACASSLRAFSHAARALQLGQIETAIVGGASYIDSDCLVVFSQAQSLSRTGSRPFDQDADGLVASEGYVSVCMKTLAQAVRDGDTVQAVVRGIGVSSDGRGKSLWAPRKEGQIEAIRRAYRSELTIDDMQYIEMHATSTQVGDATELEAMAEALGQAEPRREKTPIGSIKANVGHTLETAGLASLVKTVLAMRHGIIPSQINVERLNPAIDWQDAPFYVPTVSTPWPEQENGAPRRAAVNAFGIGGLNVHVVLEEHQPQAAG